MMEGNENQVPRKSNRQEASSKKYNISDSDDCDEREQNYAKFVGEDSDLDEDYEKMLKKNKRYIVSDSSESESGDDQVRKKFKSKPGASKFAESPGKASFVRNPFFNRKKSIEKDFSSILQNSEEQEHENLESSNEKDSNGKDSNGKDSNVKDSNGKDSNGKDSNKKESKMHPFFKKTGVSSIVNE